MASVARFPKWRTLAFSENKQYIESMYLVAIWTILHISAVAAEYNWQQDEFSWNQIRDINDDQAESPQKWLPHAKIKDIEPLKNADRGPFHIVVSFFQPIVNAFHWQFSSAPVLKPSVNISHLPLHVRVKRAKQRKLIVKCCGKQSCTDVSSSNIERSSDRRKKQDEAEFVNDLQYSRPKKKRKKSGAMDLTNLQAFGVFTDNGIHISCAGCPAGWPDMLTVYPEYEIGIPVSCSNCPNNWPGALNLLGMGGDSSWQQRPQSSGGRNPGRGRGGGNNFYAFDTGSNFGSRPGGGNVGVFPPSNFGGGGGRGYDEDYDGGAPPPSRRPKKKGSTVAPDEEGEEGEDDTSEPNPKRPKKPAPKEEDEEYEDEDDDYAEVAPKPTTISATTVAGVTETTTVAAAGTTGSTAAAGNAATAAAPAGNSTTAAAGDDDEKDAAATTAAKDAATTAKAAAGAATTVKAADAAKAAEDAADAD